MEKIILTGGAGFIGSHVVEELAKREFKVTVIDNLRGGSQNLQYFFKYKNIKFIKADINKPQEYRRYLHGAKTIFHIAAHAAEGQSVFSPLFNAKTNIMGSITILKEAINANIRNFVFTSSIAAYGKPKKLPIDEDQPLNPKDPYGISKMVFENYLRLYHELGQIDPFIVRFFNVYGPRQRMNDPYRGVVPIFINKALRNEPPIIFGDGKQQRAFTYISDIVKPICDVINIDELINNPVNIGSSKPYSIKYLAERILSKMNLNIQPKYMQKRSGDIEATFCKVSKAKKLLGYEAKMDLEEGLDDTIRWAKNCGHQNFKYTDLVEIERLRPSIYREKQI